MSDAPLRLLLADDEPLALRRLQLALKEMSNIEVVAAVGDGARAIEAMHALKPDVAILDVKMPLKDGFEVAAAVAECDGPSIIFVSAYDLFAVRAFEAAAVDYVVKPVEFDRLAAAIERARARRAADGAERRVEELARVVETLRRDANAREGMHYDQEFWIRDRGRFLRVPVADIDRIEAERDYVRLYWEGRTLLHRETMSHLEQKLDPSLMLRVHRSAFVNWRRLRAVRRDGNGRLLAVLADGEEVPVSRAYAQRVLAEVRARS